MSKEDLNLPMVDEHMTVSCCAGEESLPDYGKAGEASWVIDQLDTAAGPLYRVATTLDRRDRLGSIKARWGLGRMSYAVPPGLYGVGRPGSSSPVLVSANYKLSFDSLRRELSGFDLWILVLDTKGVNVWCAAGKGTFSTEEVARMVQATPLAELVSHRVLILPQLSAPGVSAFQVRRRCGFKVIFGPVRADDLPAFLGAGNRADPAMRRTRFELADRLVLTPVELSALAKPLAAFTLLLLLLNLASLLVDGEPMWIAPLIGQTLSDLFPFLIAMLIGAVFVPALLPYIPGRAFSWKGLVLGLIWAAAYRGLFDPAAGWLQAASHFLLIPAITSFLGMNFTGSSTYTSLSGVVKEMKFALPLIIAAAALGLVALIAAYFV